ncbi:terminase large subunit domain-containing protein [Parablautia intestinalis]|uniref:terminase large subunit domain-containing protein n=1 Tax=Parablautia intestinalis TaxID=2320100 RepID=UPI00259C712A|nr:terminase large subunit [Parablautia intestinalis]
MRTNYRDIPEIYDYIYMVENGGKKGLKKVCLWQKKLVKFVKKVLENESLTIDTEQLQNYIKLEKYFDFELYPWEKFVFTLHCCVYRKDGLPRFPDLLIFVGRGAGKNGYLAFEDFALISQYNGIPNYDIDICATAEEQAKTTFDDIYNVLEKNRKKLIKFFRWTKTEILCIKTRSKIKYRTNNAKSKDGLRSGKVDFDEVHAYESYDNIKVFTTALGKKPHPRMTYTTTNGDVCDGVLDDLIEKSKRILDFEIEDNGFLPFMCMLDDPKEVHKEENWHKANPSLQYMPNLLEETRKEYREWKENRSSASDFMTKRMNVRQGNSEVELTTWENILITRQEVEPPIPRETAVIGLDYTKINDFAAAGVLTKRGPKFVFKQHTWICANSADLPRIRFPYMEAVAAGDAEIIDAPEIPPELIADWVAIQMSFYNITMLALDDYRYALMKAALVRVGFTYENKNIKLVRPSDKIKIEPIIDSGFRNHNIVYGDCPIMRWYTNNTKKVKSKKYGNYEYQKIEAKSRKTDGFFAFVAAMTQHELIPEQQGTGDVLPLFTF